MGIDLQSMTSVAEGGLACISNPKRGPSVPFV